MQITATSIVLMFLTITAAQVSSAAHDVPTQPDRFRRVAIPKREHGYSKMKSSVIRTRTELENFLKTLRGQDGWNNRKGFEDAIAKAKVDFNQEALIFLRHTEGSGSVRVTFENPSLRNRVFTSKITRKVPEVGTDDMAYYCFALAVSKSAADKIKLNIEGKKPIELSIIEKQSMTPGIGDK